MTVIPNLEFYIFSLTSIDARYSRKDIEIPSEGQCKFTCAVLLPIFVHYLVIISPCNPCLTNLKDTLEEEELGHLKSLESLFT